MKQFLSGIEKDQQIKRFSRINKYSSDLVDAMDYSATLRKRDIMKLSEQLIKVIKKARKAFSRGGFTDEYNLGDHEIEQEIIEEPPFADHTGKPMIENPLTDNFRMATLKKRPKTRQLKVKK